ncbi:type II toxin-antitoxin system HigB family toxin [Dyadobacter sandarakinus]|uniref:Type II toxin-antitoxin system HigB family toxin n=1 Tax=Dyadobacter sandarakinus TaxID=2747268 RepID=A0ABX7I9N0_9BACT|nr:type II toxin-antitoxin system HigB family toxin [Dyadobacter sandarakinus]QRR01671.1 type II toxin-antitoxin system HigB family toxin [Dyadobacter sandarakinus]
MVIIKQKTLHTYSREYPEAKIAISEWAEKTERADWANFSEVKSMFNSTDYVGDDRYVFNIKGNKYRMVAMIFFTVRTVYIRWFGTHAEYSKIDVTKI